MVGRRWLASFQHSVPSQEAKRPIENIRPMNSPGVGPNGIAKACPLAAFQIQNAAKPAAASGSVDTPCAVAQERGLRSACARSQSALRSGYQVQQATAPTASSAPRGVTRQARVRVGAQLRELDLVDERDAGAISASDGASRAHGSRPVALARRAGWTSPRSRPAACR